MLAWKPGEKADEPPKCGIFSSVAWRPVLGGRAGWLTPCRFLFPVFQPARSPIPFGSGADLTKRLEPWLEYEIGALAERLPGRHGEPHEANREAMA